GDRRRRGQRPCREDAARLAAAPRTGHHRRGDQEGERPPGVEPAGRRRDGAGRHPHRHRPPPAAGSARKVGPPGESVMIIEPDPFYSGGGVFTWSPERSEASWEASYRRLQELLVGGAYRKVVILVGLPGCGKSTYTAANDAADVIVFDGLFIPPERRA